MEIWFVKTNRPPRGGLGTPWREVASWDNKPRFPDLHGCSEELPTFIMLPDHWAYSELLLGWVGLGVLKYAFCLTAFVIWRSMLDWVRSVIWASPEDLPQPPHFQMVGFFSLVKGFSTECTIIAYMTSVVGPWCEVKKHVAVAEKK